METTKTVTGTIITDPDELAYCNLLIDRCNYRNLEIYGSKPLTASQNSELRSIEAGIESYERKIVYVGEKVSNPTEVQKIKTVPTSEYITFLTRRCERLKTEVDELKASEKRASQGFVWNGYSTRVIDAIISYDRAMSELQKEQARA